MQRRDFLRATTTAIAGASFLWLMWRLRWRLAEPTPSADALASAAGELRPSRVLTLGVANLLNLVFMNADILLLGAMTSTAEVGR